MTTRHLVNPELLAVLDVFPDLRLSQETLSEVRQIVANLAPPESSYSRPDVSIERRQIAGPPGSPDLGVILYRPLNRQGPLPALIHIHAGGYVLGSAEDSGASNVRTAAEVGCLVVAVEYRLAPETKAPGAIEDCYAALQWVHMHAVELEVDQLRIAVTGESAGGGLAASLALMARDRGAISISFQMLIYPMLDDRTGTHGGDNPNVGEFIWTAEANAFAWRAFLNADPGSADVSPYAAPARAKDLSGLPSTYISVGALDLFVEEDIAFATRLLRAGVAVELHVIPGAYHGFEVASDSALARASERERRIALADALRTKLVPAH